MKKARNLLLLLIMCMAVAMPLNAQAASQKTKALAAYNKLLQKTSITLEGDKYKMSGASFAIVYINNDSVPELFLKVKKKYGNDHVSRIAVYTYKNGKVKLALTDNLGLLGDYGNTYSYYKKTGVFSEHFAYGDYTDDSYYKMSGTKLIYKLGRDREYIGGMNEKINYTYYNGKGKKCTKSEFKSLLKKMTKSKKRTVIELRDNTAANRKSYLK